jgi:hypothetical protein
VGYPGVQGLQFYSEEEWFNISLTASDIDIERGEVDEISYLVSDPDKVTVTPWSSNPLNATISFYPTNDDVGTFEFTISIKDKESNIYIHETTIEVVVKNSNDEPSIVSVQKYLDDDIFIFPEDNILDLRGESKIDLEQDQTLILLITAEDLDLVNDDEVLTFHSDAIGIIELDQNTGLENTVKLIIKPGKTNIGLLVFNITVKDQAFASDSVQIILTVENVNDRPIAKIDKPIMPGKSYFQDKDLTLEGDAEDFDIPYGDVLTYTWTSDKDGELDQGKRITVSNLSLGKHIITFTVEDQDGEISSNSTTIIILEPEETIGGDITDDKSDDSNMLFYGAVSALVIIIVVMLLILFLILKAHKKGKKLFGKDKDSEKKPFDLRRPGEIAPGATTGEKGTGAPGVVKPPTQYVPPAQGIPQTLPEDMSGTPESTSMQPPVIPFTPPQVTTCPKCSTIMTFSPDGSTFCLACGYSPGNK